MNKDKNIYDWYDDNFKKFNAIIDLPENYKQIQIPINYKNIIDEIYEINNSVKVCLKKEYNITNDTEIIKAHKYKLNFSNEQRSILKSYFSECEKLYNICVDVWKKYNDMTTEWRIVKDIIFKNYYREKYTGSYDSLIDKIIIELKDGINKYNKENEKYKDEIKKQKDQNKINYIKNIENWNKIKEEYKKKGLKYEEPKPKLEKVNIKKEPKIRKKKGDTIKKPAPDDTLKAVIRDFCKDLKTNRTKKYNDKNYTFEMKYKNVDKKQTISISDRAIILKGIFKQALGELKCSNYQLLYKKYDSKLKESTLTYNKLEDKYYINVIHESEMKNINGRQKVVALDPGEKVFMSFYSFNKYGKIYENSRIWILRRYREIKKIQSILSKNRNKNKRRIKHKKSLKLKIHRLYKNIKNKINEMHKKAAKYLCENYEHILIPSFETKPMISNKKFENEKKKLENIKNIEEKRKKLKELYRNKKISEEIKFVISMQSHYKFKEYLKAKAKEYKTIVTEVDEKFTSQSCSKCGELSNNYKNRLKMCKCGYSINRDVNGARNILIKSIRSIYNIGQ